MTLAAPELGPAGRKVCSIKGCSKLAKSELKLPLVEQYVIYLPICEDCRTHGLTELLPAQEAADE
jgi:hypothetical protein